MLTTPGFGNLDCYHYAQGRANLIEEDENYGKWRDGDSGDIMSDKEMVEKCINEGDFTEEISEIKEALKRQYTNDYLTAGGSLGHGH